MTTIPDGLILSPDGIVRWDTQRATSVRFVVPGHFDLKTGKEIKMPTMLINDVVSNIPLEFDNLAGGKVSPPAGGNAVPTSSDTAVCTVAMGVDGSSVDVTPVGAIGTQTGSATLSFADTTPGSTLTAPTLDVGFTGDTMASSVHWVTTGITTRPLTP